MASTGLVQQVENGKIVESVSTASNKKKEEVGGTLDYDAFLQILCAEMQYQDPLEPTSNTEYIAQLATFSQLESNLSMQNTIEGASANDLVGKYVIMKVTSSTTGETSYASGYVDYVLHQNGNTYLSIDNSLYSLEDLDTVADEGYVEAVALADDFDVAIAKLPAKNLVTLDDKAKIQAIRAIYDSLTDYQKSFINEESYTKFTEIETRLNELIAAAEAAGGTTEGTTGSTGSEGTTDDSTEGSSGSESADGNGATDVTGEQEMRL